MTAEERKKHALCMQEASFVFPCLKSEDVRETSAADIAKDASRVTIHLIPCIIILVLP